ncbi:MAG TPA: D-alanyl-D-alanine carboxypeptidase/D-alanyl-D-alanine-endopeptidase [Candidatus Binatia bacterium]|nr:D-alanyl-D-alanine carboxypeptidase/D-alanyl-D-alanine-endopeptidase [Candidatus Binatia bacterium]
MSYVKSSVSFRRRSNRSRARKRRALACIALLLGAVALWFVVQARSSTKPPAAEQARTQPPSRVSAYDAPEWSDAERSRLWKSLHGAFVPAIAGAKGWSFAVVAPDGATLFDERANRAVAPASAQKLIVAATALDALGPAFRFHTLFASRDAIAEGGALDGDLWLIGSGDPSLQSADLRNGVGVLARSGLRRVGGSLVVDASAMRGPALNAHWGAEDDGQEYAAPTSALSVDGDTAEDRPMDDVVRYVAARVDSMLAARGIALAAPPGVGVAPLGSVVLWDHRSLPLTALESHMLFESDNHYAEQLLRTVGEAVTGAADDDGGIAAERRYLRRLGIPAPGLRIFDGSGLSAQNRVAAITLARLLAQSEAALYRLLPLGGREGTLQDYDFTTALGRVRAKSGHLADVSSLAGYVTTRDRGRLAFAFLIDGSPGDPDAAIVQAVDRLAVY